MIDGAAAPGNVANKTISHKLGIALHIVYQVHACRLNMKNLSMDLELEHAG